MEQVIELVVENVKPVDLCRQEGSESELSKVKNGCERFLQELEIIDNQKQSEQEESKIIIEF